MPSSLRCLLSLVICSTIGFSERTNEEHLLEYLFEGYNQAARPVFNSSQTVAVNLRFSLLQIQELNVRSQVLTTTGLLILDWVDERLSWDESVSDLEEIVVHGENIWRPDFAVINGAESIYGDYKEFQAVLRRDGRVRWEPGGVFRTMCPIDITFYPFDEQTCELQFGAWSYYTTKMNLTTDGTNGLGLEAYETNGEWEIIETSVERREFHFECCPDERFSNIAFSVALRRRHEFYIMNVVLPGVLTSAVLLSIFYCIPSQKVHIGVAALLSFRLFLVNVADTVPRTSDHVPLLGIYLTCTMAITTLAMVATVFVGNLYETKDHPVPSWARTVLLKYAAHLLGYCTRCVDPAPGFEPTPAITQRPAAEVEDEELKWRRHGPCRLVTLLEESQCQPRSVVVVGDTQKTRNNGTTTTTTTATQTIVYKTTNSEVKVKVRNVLGGALGCRPFAKDWANVGAVCDRLFFWLCLVLTIVTTLMLFHPLIARQFTV